MKKIAIFLVLVACLAALPALAAKKHAPAKAQAADKNVPSGTVNTPGKLITEPNAFHGIKWGTPMAAVSDIKVVEKAGQAVYASVPGVVYRIGDSFMNDVVYAFCQDKFAAVMVEFRGRKAFESVKKFLTEKYTPPLLMGDKADSLGWPIGNVLIRMEYTAADDSGMMSYFYQPLYAPCLDNAPLTGAPAASQSKPPVAPKAGK
jgi:hypothetical protein